MSTIIIYTAPLCPYCTHAKRLLNNKNVSFEEISIADDPSIRHEMIQKSQRTTVPQIFNGDTHVGDCTEIYDLESRGQLDALLA